MNKVFIKTRIIIFFKYFGIENTSDIKKNAFRQGDYTFPAGTTAVKSSHDMVPFSALRVTDEEVMEIS